MQPARKFYSISEAAQELGVSAETLRRWERSGKITVGRTPTGNRIFTQEDISRLNEAFFGKTVSQNVGIVSHNEPNDKKITLPQPYTTLHTPKLSYKFNYKTGLFALMFLITVLSASLSFYTVYNYTPFPKVMSEKVEVAKGEAVLGVETYIFPLLTEVQILTQRLIVSANEPISRFSAFLRTLRSAPLVVALFGPAEPEQNVVYSTFPEGIKVEGNNITLGSSNLGTTTVNNSFVVLGTSVLSDVRVQSLAVEGSFSVAGSIENVENITATGDIRGEDLTLSGTINTNTFTGNRLIFSGSSPSIYPSTTNTSISLNASGTGAINIGNSGTGDVYIAGGSGDGGCTITNNNGTLNCSGNITSAGDLIANGGDILTDQTTFNLLTSTVTTLNIGSSSTTINLQGTASFTKAPTQAHTGTWAIDSSTWNVSNASLYVNPASATADSNLLGVAVNGGVKFAVDAEGDVFARNLVLTGNTTTGTTTVSGDLTVEGNTVLGDSTTDTITLNPATITLAGGNKTLDLTGAATRTLTLLNSTGGQIADIDLSDGNLKVNGATIITNAGAGSFTTVGGTITTASQTNITAVGTLTSLAVTGNINSGSGSLQTNGVTRLDNSGNLTAGTGSFGGAITPSLDDTYDIGTAVLRFQDAFFSGDVTAGDLVFKNNFRFTERGETGMDILNPKGEIIGGFDDQGNLWMKGEIRQWAKN